MTMEAVENRQQSRERSTPHNRIATALRGGIGNDDCPKQVAKRETKTSTIMHEVSRFDPQVFHQSEFRGVYLWPSPPPYVDDSFPRNYLSIRRMCRMLSEARKLHFLERT